MIELEDLAPTTNDARAVAVALVEAIIASPGPHENSVLFAESTKVVAGHLGVSESSLLKAKRMLVDCRVVRKSSTNQPSRFSPLADLLVGKTNDEVKVFVDSLEPLAEGSSPDRFAYAVVLGGFRAVLEASETATAASNTRGSSSDLVRARQLLTSYLANPKIVNFGIEAARKKLGKSVEHLPAQVRAARLLFRALVDIADLLPNRAIGKAELTAELGEESLPLLNLFVSRGLIRRAGNHYVTTPLLASLASMQHREPVHSDHFKRLAFDLGLEESADEYKYLWQLGFDSPAAVISRVGVSLNACVPARISGVERSEYIEEELSRLDVAVVLVERSLQAFGAKPSGDEVASAVTGAREALNLIAGIRNSLELQDKESAWVKAAAAALGGLDQRRAAVGNQLAMFKSGDSSVTAKASVGALVAALGSDSASEIRVAAQLLIQGDGAGVSRSEVRLIAAAAQTCPLDTPQWETFLEILADAETARSLNRALAQMPAGSSDNASHPGRSPRAPMAGGNDLAAELEVVDDEGNLKLRSLVPGPLSRSLTHGAS